MRGEQEAKSTHPNMEIKDILKTHNNDLTKLCSKGNLLEGDKEVEKENEDEISGGKELIDEQSKRAKKQTSKIKGYLYKKCGVYER